MFDLCLLPEVRTGVVAPGVWFGHFLSEAQGGSCEKMELP